MVILLLTLFTLTISTRPQSQSIISAVNLPINGLQPNNDLPVGPGIPALPSNVDTPITGDNLYQTTSPYGNPFINNYGTTNNNHNLFNNNGISKLLIGTYQWIGQSGNIFTLYICTGINGDRNIYSAISRNTINAFDISDDDFEMEFSHIISRGLIKINDDSYSIIFNGFRIHDAFGIDDDFEMEFIFQKCDNIYQLDIFDETYTLSKIGTDQPLQQQCFRPSFTHNFNTLDNFAQFASDNLPFNFPTTNHNNQPSYRSIYSFRRHPIPSNPNLYNIFSCSTYQNPFTQHIIPGYRTFYGNYGPYGKLTWKNSLLINSFNDNFNNNFKVGCRRGLEIQMFLDDGNIWCNTRCSNQPTVGWSGILKRINLINGFGIDQCPIPNYGNIDIGYFPGFIPFNWNVNGY